MNTYCQKKLTLVTILILGFHSVSTQVVWSGDPTKNHRTQFAAFDIHGYNDSGSCGDNNHEDPTLSTVNDAQFGNVWRIRKKKGRKRAELARPLMLKSPGQVVNPNRPFPPIGNNDFLAPEKGQTLYYGWRMKIQSNPGISGGISIWQWKTSGGQVNSTQNYPLTMGYNGTSISLSAYGPAYPTWNSAGGSISKRKTTIWEKNMPEDTWVSIVIGMKLSTNKDVGYVELWFDGKKQTLKNSDFNEYKVKLSNDKKRAYHKTYDGQEVHPKWGVYNSNACNYDITYSVGDMKIAKQLQQAMPGGIVDSGGPEGYVYAANENGTVKVSGKVNIAYGANGSFNYKYNVTDHTPCTNTVFGDPIRGTVKKCYIKNVAGIKSGIYHLKNVATGQYLDSDGDLIKVSNLNSSNDRKWRFVATNNGHYNIDSMFQNRGILDSEPSGKVIGSDVEPISNDVDKQWKPIALGNNIYRFENRASDRKYLSVNTSTKVVGYSNRTGNSTKWELIETSIKASLDTADITKGIELFPNPASTSINVTISNDLDVLTLFLMDSQGRKIYTHKEIKSKEIRIDLFGYPKGFYILNATDHNGQSFTKKVLIQ